MPELSDAWLDGDDTARWRSAAVTGPGTGAECVPHEVVNAGSETLRFAAVYAAADVTTTYERPVQPDGEAERSSVA